MDIKDEQTGQPEQATQQTKPPLTWEYKEELGICKQMREVAQLAKLVSENEVDRLRRKVEKLKYGS